MCGVEQLATSITVSAKAVEVVRTFPISHLGVRC